jgi:hypothetical protein
VLDHQQVVVYLDSIDKRLLDDSARMTGSTAPHFPRKATGGRAPSINIDSGHSTLESASLRSASGASNGPSRERAVAIFGQFVWALREPRRR